MSFFVSFLISLAISIVMSVISSLLTPPPQTTKSSVSAGELGAPTAEEGTPVPHIRGTRWVAPNCIWWTPTGNSGIYK
ncbi:MAG: hypothetical protein PHN64_03565 [Desulfovibrionaceae bacterium]|jgi:hypothetical protein|nr:hypothetical protein [Desulfovibrionaceae bacterium]